MAVLAARVDGDMPVAVAEADIPDGAGPRPHRAHGGRTVARHLSSGRCHRCHFGCRRRPRGPRRWRACRDRGHQ
eukprot:7042377-Lingulodinium_polyedra.AAC.1